MNGWINALRPESMLQFLRSYYSSGAACLSIILLGGCSEEVTNPDALLSKKSKSKETKYKALSDSSRSHHDTSSKAGASDSEHKQRKFFDFDSDNSERTHGEPAWKLTFDQHRFGRCVGLATPDRIIFRDGVTFRLLVPPYTEAVVFSTENERYFVASMAVYETEVRNAYKAWKIKPVGREKVHGLDCQRFRFYNNRGEERGSFMTTRTIDVAPKLADECCYMCSIPGGYGFPVELSLIEKGKRVYRLRPVKVERTKATREDFKAPTGFKEARDIFELQFCEKSKSYSDAMNDLFMTAPDEK